VLVLRRDSTRASPVGRGVRAVGSLDGRGVRIIARYPEVRGVAGDLVLWGGHEEHAGPFTLAIRRLDLPAYDGSDSFVPWPAAGA
jgi:hypothetical protein